MEDGKKRLYLVDGSSYIFRAYYAIGHLSTSKGLPTNAIYGFIKMLLKLVNQEKPDFIAVVFDREEPTFRDEMYPLYKANRKAPPDDLVLQFPYFERAVQVLGIRHISMPGFEADDVIGTLAKRASLEGFDVVLVTGDKDFSQLVSDKISIYDTMKDVWIREPDVKKRFGVVPSQVIDFMSLVGDTSDNIPGVKGVGDKGAAALINQFGSLEGLISNIGKVSNKRLRDALEKGIQDARLSKDLVTIRTDVPIDISIEDLRPKGIDKTQALEFFRELEFYKLIEELSLSLSENRPSYQIAKGDVLKNTAGTIDSHAALYLLTQGDGAPAGIGMVWGRDALYIPLSVDMFDYDGSPTLEDVREFFAMLKDRLVVYDGKEFFKKLGMEEFIGKAEDIGLMAYTLDSSIASNLGVLIDKVLSRLVSSGSQAKENPYDHSVYMAQAIYEAYPRLLDRMRGCGKSMNIYKEIELPLSRVLAKMERRGVFIDKARIKELSDEYGTRLAKLEKEIFELAGEEFNVNSPRQLGTILFEKMKLPFAKKTKTGWSTDSTILEKIAKDHSIARLILDYRSISKLKTTYLDTLPKLVAGDGRVHTTFNQMATATGRLSSSDPNLQNIPTRTEDGKRIRMAFVAQPGFVLLSADYSQIELRILAHISKEEWFLDAFRERLDVHAATAAKIYGVDVKDVSEDMRRMAKTVNFGILYGQSAYGLSEQLGIDVHEADAIIKSYYSTYKRVAALKDKIISHAREKGFVETLYGRRRYLPDINSKSQQTRALAERMAFNTVFQGTAADIIKMAMIELDRIISEKFQNNHMIIQVHDELIFEVEEDEVDAFKEEVSRVMTEIVQLSVPLVVDIGVGKTWADCYK